MLTIWKATLNATDVQQIAVPQGAELLCVREQYEQIALWFRCDPNAPMEARTIAICETGHPAPPAEESRYLGTASLQGGRLILHAFERVQ